MTYLPKLQLLSAIALLATFGCNRGSEPKNRTDTQMDTTHSNSAEIAQHHIAKYLPLEDGALKEAAKKSVSEFFSHYIQNVYRKKGQVPNLKKTNGLIYKFDYEQLHDFLQALPNLSDGFIQNELSKLSDCNQALEKIEWEEEPEHGFNVSPCNYLWSYDWVGGQEEITTDFKISEVLKFQDTINIKVKMIADGKVMDYLTKEVLLTKKEKWTIDRIISL